MFPIVTMTITWILVIARFIIAVQLTRVGRRQKLPNLLWLAAFFYITGTGDIFITLSPMTKLLWPFFLAVGLGEVMLVMFIHKTFYQDRKSPYLIFMVIALGILVVDLISLRVNPTTTYLPHYNPFNWLWLIWVGYQAYKKIATNPAVEDWVKARYRLIIAYSLAALAAPLYSIISIVPYISQSFGAWFYTEPTGPTIQLIAQVGILVFVTIGIALEYLAWVMPENYRKWLNRNYHSPVHDKTELSAEEVMRKLKAQA
ncbi:MAG TPA: hypothetical protein VHP14_20495 [Anaerolineales bacterium]|nr:hypothetical protein [Anaerolineales bacterium]